MHKFNILLLLFAVTLFSNANAVIWSFDKQPLGEQISQDKGMGRNYFFMSPDKEVIKFTINQKVSNNFTISAWIKIASYPNDGKLGFTKINPATIVDFSGKNGVQLRLNGKRLEFSIKHDGKWIGISGGELPLNRWILVSGVLDDGEMTIYVNGVLFNKKSTDIKNFSNSFTKLTMGGTEQRKFIGGIDEVSLDENAVSEETLKQRTASRGKEYTRDLYINWQAVPTPLKYKYLRTEKGARYPLAEGSALFVTVVPWSGKGKNDLIIGDPPSFFGSRITLHNEIDSKAKPTPVVSDGVSIALQGIDFRRIDRKDGNFDLIANGRGTPWGANELIFYENLGAIGQPQFSTPQKVKVDNKSFSEAIPFFALSWTLADINNDEVLDILVAARKNDVDNYFPDKESFWNRKANNNSGPKRGYDVQGNWLGDKNTMLLYWAPGIKNNDNIPEFGKVKPVYVGDSDYALQWRFYSPAMIPGYLENQDGSYILLAGDVDKLIALPCHLDDNSDLRCQNAKNVLKDNKSLDGVYWPHMIQIEDLNRDGKADIVVSGNPGRIILLEGEKIGEFTESGSIQIEAGPVELDTLVTPARGDWDGDGIDDLICGDASGYITFWQGTKDSLVYKASKYLKTKNGKVYQTQAGDFGSFQGPNERRWGYAQPTLGDWDNDGKLDIISNDINSEMVLIQKNSNSAEEITVTPFTSMDGKALDCAWRVRPAILDNSKWNKNEIANSLIYLDFDGDLVIATPEKLGSTKIKSIKKLKYQDDKDMRMCGIRGFWGRAKLTVCDWDGDGNWDILFGHHLGAGRDIWDNNKPSEATIGYFRNIETNENPKFTKVRDITDKNGNRLYFHAHNASVWPTDLNNDNQFDLIVGAEDGKVYYFERNDLNWEQ